MCTSQSSHALKYTRRIPNHDLKSSFETRENCASRDSETYYMEWAHHRHIHYSHFRRCKLSSTMTAEVNSGTCDWLAFFSSASLSRSSPVRDSQVKNLKPFWTKGVGCDHFFFRVKAEQVRPNAICATMYMTKIHYT